MEDFFQSMLKKTVKQVSRANTTTEYHNFITYHYDFQGNQIHYTKFLFKNQNYIFDER